MNYYVYFIRFGIQLDSKGGFIRKIQFPQLKVRKNPSVIPALFSSHPQNTASYYDPQNAQKCTRICEDVLKMIGPSWIVRKQ